MGDSAQVTVRWVAGAAELQGVLALREDVFCREQGVSREEELDGRDAEALHVVALQLRSHEVIGTLRLLLEGEVAKIGRVAVVRGWRRRGIAAQMLALALDGARTRGAHTARLAAQLDALGLYRGAGFEVVSEPFEEAGIMHVWMAREL